MLCLHHLWGILPYASSWVFLFSGPFVEVVASPLLRMVSSILRLQILSQYLHCCRVSKSFFNFFLQFKKFASSVYFLNKRLSSITAVTVSNCDSTSLLEILLRIFTSAKPFLLRSVWHGIFNKLYDFTGYFAELYRMPLQNYIVCLFVINKHHSYIFLISCSSRRYVDQCIAVNLYPWFTYGILFVPRGTVHGF